jgi:hypothetical protein
MLSNVPDSLDLRMRFFVAVVGAVLLVIGWLRYLI